MTTIHALAANSALQKADDGTTVAVSPRLPNIKAVVAGINAVRESAATGLVVDHRSTPFRAA
ncbi:hypothetical protein [Pseudarthrobacter sp. N5]|uniref:hypothetical protein n=1 Tax=Pseudarthrobacter sp. N5 TaxID=3418416 RepID=UPI003CEA398F